MALAAAEKITCTAFGVRLGITVPTCLGERVRLVLPSNGEIGPQGDEDASVELAECGGRFVLTADGSGLGAYDDEETALGALDAHVRAQVALLAPDHIFVHAGVVAVGGRAVVMPGASFAGKTTLTRALIETGAVYFSDEFAVIDKTGRVLPYPKLLSIRHGDGSGRTSETSAGSLGGETGRDPVPVGLVAFTAYRPGAALDPQPLNSGPTLVELLAQTIPARTRPRQAISALKAAVHGADAWTSDRGEAGEAARAIIDSMR